MIIRLQHPRPDGNVDTYHLAPGRKYHIGRGSGCEVRILDFKLSRKHCAIEYGAGEWKISDLCSTNGCKVDGDQIVGATVLVEGAKIDLGQTQLRVERIHGEDEDLPGDDSDASPATPVAVLPPAVAPVVPAPVPAPPTPVKLSTAPLDLPNKMTRPGSEDLTFDDLPSSGAVAVVPTSSKTKKPSTPPSGPLPVQRLEQLPLDDEAAALSPSTSLQREPEPQPATESATKTDALESKSGLRSRVPVVAARPAASTNAITRPPSTPIPREKPKIQPVIIRFGDQAEVPAAPVVPAFTPQPMVRSENLEETRPTLPPAAKASNTPPIPLAAVGADEARTFYITVLGQRVGPLTRAAARDLKVRELKGTLTSKDLDALR